MNNAIPSKWGFCDDVYIVPIKAQNAYFTAIMDAPADWDSALTVSGFRKTNEGWVKQGLANEHELAYLSDNVEIRNVDDAFFESYFNPPKEPEGIAVPSEVANAISWLAGAGRRALSFEFSITHPEVTDAQLSGYLENAAAGVTDEGTNTVYELAIERIRFLSGNELSDSVVEFARENEINLTVQPDDVLGVKGSVQLPRGERVTWMEDGKEQFGRVSRPLRVGDDGCWVHRLPVAWVGGYPMPQEEWVSTES